MKKIKSITAVVLAAILCVFAAGCTTSGITTISEKGSVASTEKIEVSETELDKLNTLLTAFGGDNSLNASDLSDIGIKNSALTNNVKSVTDLLNNFKKSAKQEKRDNITWYIYEETQNFASTDEFNKSIANMGKVSTTDAWICGYNDDIAASIAMIKVVYNIDIKIEEQLKMPYKISKTTCKKVDDYTVSLNEKGISYIVTEKSTASWAKASNPVTAIKQDIKKAITPAKITNVKVTYKSAGKAKISWKKLSDKNITYLIERKAAGGKWQEVSIENDTNNTIDNTIKSNKKYSYRVRAYASHIALDDVVYGSYSKIKKFTTSDLTKPVVKVSASDKSATVSLSKASKKVKGYEITYSVKSNFKGAKKVTVAKLPKTIKGLKSNTKYYVKVRKFIKQGKTKVYSPYSKKLSVKVK
ncbi:MAG: fibronectin type III domain-containing protein [Acutalibacteraceae bacterium]